jgi:hypothetical protein
MKSLKMKNKIIYIIFIFTQLILCNKHLLKNKSLKTTNTLYYSYYSKINSYINWTTQPTNVPTNFILNK